MIPATSRIEWHKFISETDPVKVTSLSLKIKIIKLKRKIQSGIITKEKAIEEIYTDCQNHYELYKNDLVKIFPLEKFN